MEFRILIGDQDLGLGLWIRIVDWDLRLGLAIRITDWDWGLEIGIGDWKLRFLMGNEDW